MLISILQNQKINNQKKSLKPEIPTTKLEQSQTRQNKQKKNKKELKIFNLFKLTHNDSS